ncbi:MULTISPECIES: hypothetical protein [Rhodomicrobium]|uniref:hypothetical protein n=1 Tax=Rhodomicrobium TaxID=1068 RepID=UPI000F74A297|nr:MULTISPECIES: hypothetical protein [Rhodomicrobium]
MSPAMQAVPAEVITVEPTSYIDWSGIIVGAITATALSWLLLTFGSAIGLISVSPYEFNSDSAVKLTIAAAVWFALVQIYSIGMGAYIAARLRPRTPDAMPDEVAFRDGVTGIAVWALAIVAGLAIAGMAASSAARTGAQVAGQAAQFVGQTAATGAREADPAYIVDTLLRPSGAQPNTGTQQQPETTEATRREIGRILANGLAQGSLPDQDRQYLAQLLHDRTGLTPEEAEARVRQAYDNAKAKALEVADNARKATSFAGFWIVFIMFAAGLAAWWGGTSGGRHRDDGTWR